jgi:hypothetical protein
VKSDGVTRHDGVGQAHVGRTRDRDAAIEVLPNEHPQTGAGPPTRLPLDLEQLALDVAEIAIRRAHRADAGDSKFVHQSTL